MAHLGTSMCIGVVLPQHIDVGEDEALALLAPRERHQKGARKCPGIGKATVRKMKGDDPSWWVLDVDFAALSLGVPLGLRPRAVVLVVFAERSVFAALGLRPRFAGAAVGAAFFGGRPRLFAAGLVFVSLAAEAPAVFFLIGMRSPP